MKLFAVRYDCVLYVGEGIVLIIDDSPMLYVADAV